MIIKDNNFEIKRIKRNLKNALKQGRTVIINDYRGVVRGKYSNGGCDTYFEYITYDKNRHIATFRIEAPHGGTDKYRKKISADKLAECIISMINGILEYERKWQPEGMSYLEVI